MLAALVLTAAVSLRIEIDLAPLFPKRMRVARPASTCVGRTVGYRYFGKPGETLTYCGRTYTFDALACETNPCQMEFIGCGAKVPSGLLSEPDQFGFRDVLEKK